MPRLSYRQQRDSEPRQQQPLLAVHRVPDRAQLLVAAAAEEEFDGGAYSDVWNAASKLSRSRRRLFSTQPYRPEQSTEPSSSTPVGRTSDGERTMRVDTSDVVGSPDTGRRMSNAGSELGDWINKYQKSDHHADRLVRTIVQYEQTTGQRFPDSKLIPASYYEIKRNHVSALPDVVYVKTASTDAQPVTYDSPAVPVIGVRRPSIDRGSVSVASKYGVNNVSIQLQAPVSTGMSTRRPPVVPRPSVDLSRSTSLPPVTPDSLHRRRTSISAAYNGRSTAHERYTSPAPVSLPTIRQGEPAVSGYRRASYSGASPNYRSYVSTSASRHTTPDRVIEEDATSRLGVSGSAWSRSRSASPATNNYLLPTPPGTPRMSDARRKIRRVLNKVSTDYD